MLTHITLHRILFFDIETVPQYSNFSDLTADWQQLWDYRTHAYRAEEQSDLDAYYFEKAGVYAEFGKTICITAGILTRQTANQNWQLRLKTFAGDDERNLLEDFFALLERYFSTYTDAQLCGHHIKGFDIPFLCRRAIILGLPLPKILDANSLKPWEVPHLDTMLIWRFGDVRNMTSLHLLTQALGIPTPKQELNGSQIAAVYWQENDLNRIIRYNQQDVIALARVLMRFKGIPPLDDEQVVIAS